VFSPLALRHRPLVRNESVGRPTRSPGNRNDRHARWCSRARSPPSIGPRLSPRASRVLLSRRRGGRPPESPRGGPGGRRASAVPCRLFVGTTVSNRLVVSLRHQRVNHAASGCPSKTARASWNRRRVGPSAHRKSAPGRATPPARPMQLFPRRCRRSDRVALPLARDRRARTLLMERIAADRGEPFAPLSGVDGLSIAGVSPYGAAAEGRERAVPSHPSVNLRRSPSRTLGLTGDPSDRVSGRGGGFAFEDV